MSADLPGRVGRSGCRPWLLVSFRPFTFAQLAVLHSFVLTFCFYLSLFISFHFSTSSVSFNTMFKSTALLATMSLAASSLAAVMPVRRAQCEGYRPISEVFSIGISQQFIMDVNDSAADPSSPDYGTTKVFYEQPCEAGSEAIHEISFVVSLSNEAGVELS